MSAESLRKGAPPFRRQVSISRDGDDYVVAFQPDNVIVFRHTEARELRRICNSLHWEIVRDTVDLNELFSM